MKTLKIKNYYRIRKVALYLASDCILVLFSILAALSIWNEGSLPGSHPVGLDGNSWLWFNYMAFIAPAVCVAVFGVLKMYGNLWKYASIDEVLKIFIATSAIFLILFFIDAAWLSRLGLMLLSRRMMVIAWAFFTILSTFSRFGYRLVKNIAITTSHAITSKSGCKRVMVIGAGYSGYGVVSGIQKAVIHDKIPAIVVDPDENKNNSSLLGVRVLSDTAGIPGLVKKYRIDEIIIALPTLEPRAASEIISLCNRTGLPLKIVPPVSDVPEGNNLVFRLRDVNIGDLLYREEVKLDDDVIGAYIAGKVILVTGGGGSIGSELCRQISKYGPAELIIFDIYENNAYELLYELNGLYKGAFDIKIRIGSVRDYGRLEQIFSEFTPHVVFHAAAHKHVSLCEWSPAEAVKNNIFGTRNVIKCAAAYGAERFVFPSSDKAVNPANIMGATKRVAELLVQRAAARGGKTEYMAVRFGNVLDSDGSVLHLFKRQISNGGPVTVHRGMERYFMSIPEAAQLVLQAVSAGQSGRIYVLDMGPPVKIEELARDLIRLSGFKPDEDVAIEYTDPRPGDMTHEELILEEEKDGMQVSFHKKIIITKPVEMDYDLFDAQLDELEHIAAHEPGMIDGFFRVMLPNYKKETG